jgi:hypothetical protein
VNQCKPLVAGQADPDSKKEEKNADLEKALSADYSCAVEPPVRPCSSPRQLPHCVPV